MDGRHLNTSAAPERRKYSTGFKLCVGGWAVLGLGILLSTEIWKPLWVIGVAGGVFGIWFRGPSDWRKTWPDDFPITARLTGRTIQPRPPAATPNWWATAPASSRRTFSLVPIIGGAGLFIWGTTAPTDYHGYVSHTSALVLGPLVFVFGLVQAWRAWKTPGTKELQDGPQDDLCL